MIRSHPGRFAVVALVAAIVASGLVASLSAFAQEATPDAEPRTSLPAFADTDSPVASPVASPIASPPYGTSEFVAGIWRIGIVTAERANEFPDFDLAARPDKDWVVVIADVINWGRSDERFDLRDFAIQVAGPDDLRGFARRSTEGAAAVLGLQPEDVGEGVPINPGETERVVMVLETPIDSINPSLFIDGVAVSLQPAIDGGPAFDDLPDISEPGLTGRQRVESVVSGSVIALGSNAEEVSLSFVDAPVNTECFADQSASNLRRILTERVFVEQDGESTLIWTEEDDGSRRLLNFEQIRSGFAGTTDDLSGRFAQWLQDAESQAQASSGGLWEACTGVHGVTRTTAPERTLIRMSDGQGSTTPYRVWLEWSPELVTTPDGGAWAFFSALADRGPLQDQQRLYASRFDPASGRWLDAEVMPAGEIQFGATAVVDSKGLVHVVYSARELTGPEYLSTLIYAREDGRGGWVPPMSVSLDQFAGHQLAPSLAIDASDTLYVAWQDQRAFGDGGRAASPLNADVFVSQKSPDAGWSTPVLINNHLPTAAALLPSLVVDGDRLVAVWSVYTSAMGPENAARMEWAWRAIDAEIVDWSAPQLFANGRGDNFGGRFVDMVADPTGGVIVAYARRGVDTFLFVKRLAAGSTQWGSDTLVAFGNRGSFPTIAVNNDGIAFVGFNAETGTYGDGSGVLVDIAATAINFRSIEPGAEVILTRDDPNSQGRAVVAIDITGKPWFLFFGEIPGFPATQVGALRNANIPVSPITDVIGN